MTDDVKRQRNGGGNGGGDGAGGEGGRLMTDEVKMPPRLLLWRWIPSKWMVTVLHHTCGDRI